MLSDWELWAVANKLISEHGESAAIEAALKADEMLERADFDGQRVWLSVLRRIAELIETPSGTAH